MEYENKNIAGNTHLLIKQYNYDEAEGGVANDIIEVQSDDAVDGLAHIYKIDGTLCRVLDKNEDVRDVILPPGMYIIETHHGATKSFKKIMVHPKTKNIYENEKNNSTDPFGCLPCFCPCPASGPIQAG
jgi:hypothetical protein